MHGRARTTASWRHELAPTCSPSASELQDGRLPPPTDGGGRAYRLNEGPTRTRCSIASTTARLMTSIIAEIALQRRLEPVLRCSKVRRTRGQRRALFTERFAHSILCRRTIGIYGNIGLTSSSEESDYRQCPGRLVNCGTLRRKIQRLNLASLAGDFLGVCRTLCNPISAPRRERDRGVRDRLSRVPGFDRRGADRRGS